MEKQKINRKIIGIILAAVLCLVAGIGLAIVLLTGHKEEPVIEEVPAPVVEEIPIQEEPEIEPEEEEIEVIPTCKAMYDFEELQAENEDIYAWILVPGAGVDYPILQREEDNYYLNRNLDHSQGYPGCIYTNAIHPKDFSAYNTVVYGHKMRNGSMFGSLFHYEEEEFFEENDTILVYTPENRLTYEICAVVETDDAYLPYEYDTETEEGRAAYIAMLYGENSTVYHLRGEALEERVNEEETACDTEEAAISMEDHLITLSTCTSESTNRFLIVGKLVETAVYAE